MRTKRILDFSTLGVIRIPGPRGSSGPNNRGMCFRSRTRKNAGARKSVATEPLLLTCLFKPSAAAPQYSRSRNARRLVHL